MPSKRFTARSYPFKYEDDAKSEPEGATRDDLSDLEGRIRDWSQTMEKGISSGYFLSGVSLLAVGQSPLVSNGKYLTGSSVWKVTDNADLTGATITAISTGGISSGILGTDIAIAGTAAGTATNVIAYFLGRLGVMAATVGGTAEAVDFRADQNSHPIGGLISVDRPCGFSPVPDVPNAVWMSNVIQFIDAGIAATFRKDDYIRAAPFASKSLLDGRMKVLSIDLVTNSIIVDNLLPGMMGNESLYEEKDNPVSLRFSPVEDKYNYTVCKSSAPSIVWAESSLGPNVKRGTAKTIYLRTSIDATVDLWIW